MDAAVSKPETLGLPQNWTAGMMGMMSLIRVLPPEKFEQIMAMKQNQGQANQSHQH